MGKVLTTTEAAALVGVHPNTMRRWIREGLIEPKYVWQVGKNYLVHSDGLPADGKRPKPPNPKTGG